MKTSESENELKCFMKISQSTNVLFLNFVLSRILLEILLQIRFRT